MRNVSEDSCTHCISGLLVFLCIDLRVLFAADSDDGHPGGQPRLSEAQQERTLYHIAHEERYKNSHYVAGLYVTAPLIYTVNQNNCRRWTARRAAYTPFTRLCNQFVKLIVQTVVTRIMLQIV